jgi:cystathionine beta-lyase
VFVIADEIHADFVFDGNKHTVFASIKPEFEKNCAVCTAPTKTFNLAGLHNANIYIYDDAVRKAYIEELDRQGYSQSNVMGIVACQAAYTYGAEWLDELKVYLKGNISFVEKFLAENLPKVKMTAPQGTYLVWLDCTAYGLTDRQLKDLVVNKAGLWLDDGYIFGKGGSGFERINIACPRAVLAEALQKLAAAFDSLN